jgi:penicillin-insensitive murein DD-endopeptidase
MSSSSSVFERIFASLQRVRPLGVIAGLLIPALVSAATPWAEVSLPSRGPTKVIGGFSNGCIGGADALPETGPGYVSVRRSRNHYYGHPTLVRLVEDIGRIQQRHSDRLMMVGDLSQPRGGRMPKGHRSHQNGLDVDIWFTTAASPGEARRLDDASDPRSMVRPGGKYVSDAWGGEQQFLIETTARQPEVDRIFVNAAIKRELCQSASGDRAWLHKVRPWWGHDAHFHVRIACPAGSPQCDEQPPLPAGDGCGSELVWWFSHEARSPAKKADKRPASEPIVPAACLAVLRDS